MRTSLDTQRLVVRPGTPATLEIDVVNTTDVIDGVTAAVYGIDAAWVRLATPVVTLFPQSVGRLTLTFDVPTACPAGDSMVLVRVLSTVDPERQEEHDVWLTVEPVEAATLELRPSLVNGGSEAEIRAVVTNVGNVATEFAVSAVEPTRVVECHTSPPTVLIPPGEAHEVLVYARGQRPWFGHSAARSLEVTAVSPTITLTESARFNQRPRIPRGVVTALILAAIVALWATIFLFVIDMLRSDPAAAKAVPANWNEGGARDVSLVDIAGTMTGQVTAASTGDGLARVTVEAHRVVRAADGSETTELTGSAATADDGTYTLGALLPGTYRLRFSADGFDPVWYPAAEGDTVKIAPRDEIADLDVTLTGQPGALSGRIAAPEGADPSAPATLTLTLVPENPEDAVPPPVVIETTGDFTIPDLVTPATYRMRIERPGFDPEEFEIELGGGKSTVVDTAQLAAADGSIAGVVVDGAGEPLGGVTVTLRSGAEERTVATPTTGNVGSFVLDGLETPRTYVLTFELDGYSGATIALDLAGGEERTGLRATLVGGLGTVRGTVTDASGQPLGGVTVTVARNDFTASTSTLTSGSGPNGAGAYTISELPVPGIYTVTFSREGFISETRRVAFVAAGEQTGIDAVLRSATGVVRGAVTVDGVGRAGLVVELSDGGTQRRTQTASAPAGAFEFIGIQPGSYTLTISGIGVQQRVVVVDVSAGAVTTRDVAVGASS